MRRRRASHGRGAIAREALRNELPREAHADLRAAMRELPKRAEPARSANVRVFEGGARVAPDGAAERHDETVRAVGVVREAQGRLLAALV